MSSIIIFLTILGFLVIAHEMGHFLVAKIRGVRVIEFGLGYPPKILGFKYGETIYTLNLLPLGGFVRMHGEDGVDALNDPRSFTSKGPFTRLAILAAGAAVNAILPIFLFTMAATLPQQVHSSEVIITKIEPMSPAQTSGLMQGDAIRIVDGSRIIRASELQKNIYLKLGEASHWEVERQGLIIEREIKPRIDHPAGQGPVGISIAEGKVRVKSVHHGEISSKNKLLMGDLILSVGSADHQDQIIINDVEELSSALKLKAEKAVSPDDISILVWRNGQLNYLNPPGTVLQFLQDVELSTLPRVSISEPLHVAFFNSFQRLFEILVLLKNELSRVLFGSANFDIAGPIGIAQITGEIASDGFITLITWTALLSINLAIINLLPIPALDGGRILFVLIELFSGGRRIPPEKEKIVHFLGFAFLMTAIILVSVQDIRRLILD